VRRLEVILIRRFDRRGASQPLSVRCVNVLLVVVQACLAMLRIFEDSAAEVFEGTDVVPGAEPFAPQVWSVLRRGVPGEAVGKRIRRARR
jgi:hypothetical protein